uniref:Integrase catalytic domain-containing protein n=1 Tax=Lactuca sativa TaxID=4236 RepID=A0A9R1VKI5_LACSA|nr:hypothetical protein LSAT_V11C500272090 [Lactuca sativa]
MVASVNIGEIYMVSSLIQAICARGWFVDTRATVHDFRTYRPMPPGTVVVCADGHRAEVQGRGDVRLKFTCGEWVTLRDVLHVLLSRRNKFDKGGFKMVLENGKIVITKGRRYVGKANNYYGMYHLCLSDEGSASGYSVDSNGASVASMSSVASNDVTGGLVANAEVENQLERHIKILRSDKGGEYFNQEFDTFYEENGMKHERTSPYTLQKNGLAERKSRTLCEMVNYMLNQSGQPNNLITSRLIPTSPYELWKGRKPNLDYLKVWGCVAYYRTPDPKRTKLGARTNKSIFIGYAHNSKAYRLLDIESGVVVESRDVEFFEYKFSRDEENSSHTTPTSTSQEILSPRSIVEEPRRSTRAIIEKSYGDDFYSYWSKERKRK